MAAELEQPEGGSTGESGRCVGCALACAVCKIACYTCWRRLCACCLPPLPIPKPEFAVLCLGLEGAGKSTILATLAGENTEDIQPTMGFAIKAVVTPRAVLNIKELGGSEKIRPYWDRYFSGQQAIIFVVDSTSSEEELYEIQMKLEKCLADPALSTLPFLLLCNKQDLPGARTTEKLKEKLELGHVEERQSFILCSSSVTNREALGESLELLVDMLVATADPAL